MARDHNRIQAENGAPLGFRIQTWSFLGKWCWGQSQEQLSSIAESWLLPISYLLSLRLNSHVWSEASRVWSEAEALHSTSTALGEAEGKKDQEERGRRIKGLLGASRSPR